MKKRDRAWPLLSVAASAVGLGIVSSSAAARADFVDDVCLEFLEHHIDDDAWFNACINAMEEAQQSAAEADVGGAAEADSGESLDALSAPALVGGTNVNMSRLAGNHQEVAIAIDPTNPDRMFAFSNTELGAGLFAAFSTNAGATWTYVDPSDGVIADNDAGDPLPSACCDPTASWDDFGNLFIAYITSGFVNAVARSSNGGQSFTVVGTLGADVDQPTITTGTNSVWLTYKEYAISGLPIVAQGASVTGLGAVGSFSAAQQMPGSTSCQFGDITVGPGGQVLVNCQTSTQIFTSLDADGLVPVASVPCCRQSARTLTHSISYRHSLIDRLTPKWGSPTTGQVARRTDGCIWCTRTRCQTRVTTPISKCAFPTITGRPGAVRSA